MNISIFKNLQCSSVQSINESWPELFDRIQLVSEYKQKKLSPLIKLASFGNIKTINNSLKHDENMLDLYGIEGDYDGEIISINEACKLLESYNVRAILYTSWSSTDLKPRWRVLVPLSKPTSKSEHGRMVARLNGVLGGVLAKETFTLSQGYFIGKTPNNPYTCISTFDDPKAGDFIDLLDELDKIAVGKEGYVATKKSSNFDFWLADLLDGNDINGNALRLVGRMVAQGHDDQTILDTFDSWGDELMLVRDSSRVTELLGSELNRMIKGARDKGYAPKTLDKVIAELRKYSRDDLLKSWVDLVVELLPVDRALALDEVMRLTGVGVQALKRQLAIKDNERKQQYKNIANASSVGSRISFIYQPENVSTLADLAEAETVKIATDFELAKFAGLLVRVIVDNLPSAHYADTDLPPAPTAQTDIITKAKLLPLVERAVVFQSKGNNGQLSNIGVPEKVLDHILVNHKTIPSISAMVTHPVVTARGRVISSTGIDRETGLLLYGDNTWGTFHPYSKEEAVTAVGRIKANFLSGFEFSSKLDEAAALSLLFTAIERKLMPAAPGGLVSAAQQSTGKTTFVKIMHVILTGRDLPVMCWPDNNETEVQKMLLSTLLRSPELICFDNVGDGLTFRSPTLALAMTSPVFEGRVLGLSRDASVPTNVMMTVTGNNIKLANDEVHRWLKVSLTTSNSSPHTRQFKNPDVLKYGLSIREQVLRDCIGIIAGYRQQTERIAPASRFQDWDGLVRQPLLWAGELDVGRVFDANMEQSEEIGARMALVIALYEYFPSREFKLKEIVNSIGWPECINIKDALIAMHVKNPEKEQSVGFGLSKLVGIPVPAPDLIPPVSLTLCFRLVSGLKRYKVEAKAL